MSLFACNENRIGVGRGLLVSSFGFVLAASAIAQSASGQYPFVDPFKRMGKVEYAKDHVIVAFQPGIAVNQGELFVKQLGLDIDRTKSGRFFTYVRIPDRSMRAGVTAEAAIKYLNLQPSVRYAEFDSAITPDFIPNDPSFSNLYALHNTGQTGGTADADMDVPAAWDITGVGNEVVVAVCDDGVDWGHPDLAANIWANVGEIPGNGIDDDANGFIDDIRGWDFNQGDNNPIGGSGDSHGTHVAGTVGAVNNNGIGITGAGRNTKIMPLRMYSNSSAPNWMSDLANAIDYAWANGAKVISVSYNIDGFTNALVEAIQRADAADVVYCNSAGNGGQLNPPRAVIRTMANNVVFVAATDHNDNKASFSNWGANIDIAAGGVDIYSTLPGNAYGNSSGTSMSTPNVASVVSVLRGFYPGMSDRQVLDRLILSADSVPQLTSFIPGGKRANLNNALESDTVPPDAVQDLTVLRRAFTVAELRFRTSGDDGMVGAADMYDIRVSTSPITDANFGSAQSVTAFVPSLPAGQLVTSQARGFWPGDTSYVAVQAIDNLGNRSPVSSFGPFNTKAGIFGDLVNDGSGFSSGGTWATTSAKSHTGPLSWTDSPGGNYGNNANEILTQTGNVVVPGPVTISFWADMNLESGFDYLRFEVSTNGGPWVEVNAWTGAVAWKQYSSVIQANPGDTLQMRFRLTSDGSAVRDGVYLDDFSMISLTEVYADDMEGGNNFTGQSPWAKTNTAASSPVFSWTDSPGGNYGNNLNISLTGTNDVLVSSIAGPALSFKTMYNLETNYDYLQVEASTDSGANWINLGSLNGVQATWAARGYNLPGDNSVRLRFRLTTDGSVVRDGAFIDDISISGEPWEALRTIQAGLRFEGYRGILGNEMVRMEVLQPGTNTVVETMMVPMNGTAFGNESTAVFTTLGSGIYDVRFTMPGYLKRRATNVNLATVAPGNILMRMAAGDANGDNSVTNADIQLIQSLLNTSSGQPGYVRAVDIDGSGTIDFWDIRAAQRNIGLSGQ